MRGESGRGEKDLLGDRGRLGPLRLKLEAVPMGVGFLISGDWPAAKRAACLITLTGEIGVEGETPRKPGGGEARELSGGAEARPSRR